MRVLRLKISLTHQKNKFERILEILCIFYFAGLFFIFFSHKIKKFSYTWNKSFMCKYCVINFFFCCCIIIQAVKSRFRVWKKLFKSFGHLKKCNSGFFLCINKTTKLFPKKLKSCFDAEEVGNSNVLFIKLSKKVLIKKSIFKEFNLFVTR